MNPNDSTADIYDIVSKPLRPQELTDAELELIRSLVSAPAKILDVGAGTGRHAVPLAEMGHSVTVIDSSPLMLDKLKFKSKLLQVIVADVLAYQFVPAAFDLIIMMWNAFDEIALTEAAAQKLLTNLKAALTESGKLLINIDDPRNFDPASLQFATSQQADGLNYELDSHVIKYDAQTRTTTSLEHVVISDSEDIPLRENNSEIVQRWWNLAELKTLAEAVGLQVKEHSLKFNAELYLELSAG